MSILRGRSPTRSQKEKGAPPSNIYSATPLHGCAPPARHSIKSSVVGVSLSRRGSWPSRSQASRTLGIFALKHYPAVLVAFVGFFLVLFLAAIRAARHEAARRCRYDGPVSMLINADHMDIVGHYKRVFSAEPESGRKYDAYDSLKSGSGFDSDYLRGRVGRCLVLCGVAGDESRGRSRPTVAAIQK